ncbi:MULTISPECIES: hypothetical protein [unclassified Devosia]|uniref:hypothetical protein n=1 Tax=unclassified Devosia TaxID=196773 RepID=UPI000B262419|nr:MULTISPECIES: hypothetical protein [unclassified Devosia]
MAWVPFDPKQPPTYSEDPLLAIYLARAQDANANRPETYGESYLAQGMSGVNGGIGKLLGGPVDLGAGLINLGIGGLNLMLTPEQTLADQIAGIRREPPLKPIVDPVGGSQMFNRFMADVGAITPETDDPSKQFVRRAGEEIGASIVPTMATMSRAARPLAAAAKELTLAAGAGIGAATADQLAPNNPWAELVGQILGTVSAAGATRLGKKLVTPFPVRDPTQLGAMEMLRREGIDLSAGQQTGHKGLQNIESELAGAQVAQLSEQQAEQFTQAVLKRAGINASRATKEVLKAGYERLGTAFGDIGSRNDILLADGKLGKKLGEAYQTYAKSTAEADRLPAIDDFIIEAVTAMKSKGGGHVIDGSAYASLRTRVGLLAHETADRAQKSALLDIQRALDDAMESNLSKGDIDAFRWARAADRDFSIIEKAALQDPSGGLISPEALQKAAVAGQGDLAKLADSGKALMTPLPSGSAPNVRNLLATVPAVAGGTLGYYMGDANGAVNGAAIGALGGVAAPYAAGRAILSKPGRRYLANQVLNGSPSGSNGFGPLGAMLAAQTSQISPSRDPLGELSVLMHQAGVN